MRKCLFFLGLVCPLFGLGQLLSGPMVGYVTMREAAVWAQLPFEAEAQLVYWKKDEMLRQYKSVPVQALRENAYAVTLVADSIEPGTTYNYAIYINGTAASAPNACEFTAQTLWQYRTDAPDFTVALGSCAFVNEEAYDRPGKPYGAEYQVFNSILAKNPNLMLWLGDNVYLREADYYARSSMFDRYTHTRSLPEMQALLARVPNYAIWDDHDYGPNNADGSFAYKQYSLEAFKTFWPSVSYGVGGTEGITSFFTWNDIDFFMLDDRWYRTPQYTDALAREILGKQQCDWLINALLASDAPFKMVCVGSQFLNSAEVKEIFSMYPSERMRILEAISKESIKNVVFLTGDRHHTELSQYSVSGGPVIYDFTVSALTSGPNTKAAEETNTFRVENTLVMQRNFGTIEFQGPGTARKMIMHIYDTSGKELWKYEVSSQE